ncbi:hypothetical protein PRIPAC_87952 [Pristionchus pacificus]|uniref:Uncharacterized protein n=1 Tax=Pristionchus pacificus TaxID=54126 RepID=A0A2A6B670_PRIPA|nr:hypothetical protein PRIPAC_87952 [Pristionchus pacificus]|eukprot:PDM61358.1 hypothetical protein PRIPAC_50800 [Pristionchus pacificus]
MLPSAISTTCCRIYSLEIECTICFDSSSDNYYMLHVDGIRIIMLKASILSRKVGYDYEVALALHSVKTRDGPLIAPFTPSASPLYSLTGSLSLIHFGELLCFLARATTAQNVKGLGNENGRDRILCEKRLGQKTEKALHALYCSKTLLRVTIDQDRNNRTTKPDISHVMALLDASLN